MGTDASRPSGRNNTLNLSADRLSSLMDELDALSEGSNARRNHTRLKFRRHAIDVEVYQPSGGSVSFCVACRNLSRGGMSVVHSSYMHVGTKCRIKMHHKTQGEQWIVGEVVQCRHVTGRVHDVGLRFGKEIDINDYVKIDPLSDSFSLERVQPEKLMGRVLLVTGNDIDRKLVEVYLSETALRMVHVAAYDEMLGQLSDPFDVVLCDFDMDAKAARQAVLGLRSAGHRVPVIAISGNLSTSAKEAIRESRVSALVPKPVERIALLRALAEFILLNRGATEDDAPAQPRQQQTDPSLKALADLFVQDLQKFAEEITSYAESGDEKNLRYICARIRGTGPLLGHSNVADAAEKVLSQLDAEGSIAAAHEALTALTSLCKLARAA